MKVRASVLGGALGLILSIALVVTLLVQREPFPLVLVLPALLGSAATMLWHETPGSRQWQRLPSRPRG